MKWMMLIIINSKQTGESTTLKAYMHTNEFEK